MPTKSVTVIPAVANLMQQSGSGMLKKKRVAAYARVSTDSEEQLNSYTAQVDHYTNHIKSNADWEFVRVYTDEGITATNTKKRDGFNEMVADALDGKMDLIITKSVSRFARNTVDSLTAVRKLKDKGVEIYFEKENIYTLDSKGELLITIMSSIAQEESRSISENVTWGQRKRMAEGKINLPYKQFLGYRRGKDGLPEIVESEAEIVRLIYKLFLEGKPISTIRRNLEDAGILSPGGKTKWYTSTVKSILKNEKYKGDALLQKVFTVDFLTKKRKANEGEVPQYYVENSHPAIITPEVFDMVQEEFKLRKGNPIPRRDHPFAMRVYCGQCGSFYSVKLWHSNSPKYRREVWLCYKKYEHEKPCATPHFYEDELKQMFIVAYNRILGDKEKYIREYEEAVESLTDTSELDSQISQWREELSVTVELMRRCVEDNARNALEQDEYQKKYDTLTVRYRKAEKRLKELSEQMSRHSAKRETIRQFLDGLRQSDDGIITAFDESLLRSTVEKITVFSKEDVRFTFKDGTEITI